ncbi:MBL fold metallo-hydrolase [Pseudomonas sp. GD04158]|uniref:ComEC/Rec2 family competence protein n=1 Tax=Pseudomonas sp. GD04158 TaxID=2975439 RepID=UPI00244B7AEB|nr:MBL fold metallo-hydrolase [Pseudomonas sp. GD04158]MDH0096547.1 MBL fold metallo-hydrolase [Pseudomonas sp. GD04158]
MSITVRVLKAKHGDCILVSHDGPNGVFNLLIDGGTSTTFRYGPRQLYAGALCATLDDLKAKRQQIDLAILTHIDDDHIHGLIKAFEKPGYLGQMVKSIWFNSSRLITRHFDAPEIPENNIKLLDNSPQTTVSQGKDLEELLDKIGCVRAPLIMAGQIHEAGPFKLKILSPGGEQLEKLLHVWPAEVDSGKTSAHSNDYKLSLEDIWQDDKFQSDASIYNGSSIAFILEADDKRMLFLGDAHDDVVSKSLRELGCSETNKLKLDLVKLSHHGSQYNTSSELLQMLDAPIYIVSTDGSKHGLPNKRTIARIIKSTQGKVLFNYDHVIASLLLANEVKEYSSRLEALNDDIKYQ